MLRFALRRILQFIPTVLAITLILFLLLNILPGDAALMSGDAQDKGVDPRFIEEMKKRWGLDQPIHIRYLTYLKNLAVGDLGLSYLRREKVSGLIASRLWPTLRLAFAAMLIAVSIGIPLGFYSALRQGTWLDAFSMVGAVSGVSIPQFWLGLLLMFFLAVKVPLFPVQGYGDGDMKHILLPAFTLGVGYMALLARTTRAAVVEILTTDYIRTARAKGLSELMGSTVVVEKLFSWPGLGSLMVDSIFMRDIPVTQGCVLLIILVFLLVNLSVDLLYAIIDPRVEYR
jgi:ABC-type dipeptide/oligopeptide/nickel transport system permease component